MSKPTKSLHTQGTSTWDLILLKTTFTSTSDLSTGTHVATQTKQQVHQDVFSTDSDSDAEEELPEIRETDEETSPKRLVPDEEQTEPRNDEEEAGSSRLESSSEGTQAEERSGEEPAIGTTFSAPVDKVEIIRNEGTIKNTYWVEIVQFNWTGFYEEKISKEANRAHKRETDHLRSQKRALRKERRKCEATIKEHTRKLLRSQAMNDSAQKDQLQQQVAQMCEQLNKNQQEQIKLQQQMVDQIAKLAANQEEAMKKEQEGKRFVFSLGGKHKRVLERVWNILDQSQMVQLIKRLYQKFKIKLRQITINCGMQFVLDVPTENAEALEEQQAAIQETIIEQIVPEDFQGQVEWEALAGECELKPPVQVSEVLSEAPAEDGGSTDQQIVPARESLLTFDPMTAVPRRFRAFQTPRMHPGMAAESEDCRVTSLLITKSKLLVFAVFRMMKVTSIPLDSPSDHVSASLCLNVRPWDLAIFINDVIAVASNTDVILLLEAGRDTIREVKEVKTVRRYTGVTSFGDGDILVVSSTTDSRGPAVIDAITEDGNVLWTVVDRTTIPALRLPLFLHVQNHDVLVSDKNGQIHRVDIASRTPHPALSHPNLKNPGQVTTDHKGQNVFVCSCQEKCVLVYSMTSGQWRTLLTGPEHGERGRDTPQAVGVTEDGMVVVAWEKDMAQSRVIVYDLKP